MRAKYKQDKNNSVSQSDSNFAELQNKSKRSIVQALIHYSWNYVAKFNALYHKFCPVTNHLDYDVTKVIHKYFTNIGW